MSDKKDTSLIPRPSSELARIPPGTSAIIDGMVNDATDIIRARDANQQEKTGSQLSTEVKDKLIVLAITIIWFSVEARVRKFGDVAQIVLWELGETARPYLKMCYKGVRHYPGMESIAQEMDNDETIDAWLAQSSARHRIGDYEFRESDYQQILTWAKAVGMRPDKLVVRMQGWERDKFVVSDGAIIEFRWSFRGIGLDLSQVPHLKTLFCVWKDLTELDLSQVLRLQGLYCWGNRLTELDLSQMSHLKWLACWENHLTELDLSRAPSLETLHCADNRLTELDISSLKTQVPLVHCDPDVRIHKRNDQNPKISRG